MDTIFSRFTDAIRDIPSAFRDQPRLVSYDDLFKDPKDGCARYDDVWGG